MALITLQQMYDTWKRVSDWVSGTNTDRPKVQNVNSAGTEIFTATAPGNVQITGSIMEYYGKSTDTKPTSNVKIGSTFFEIDSKEVYMFDGTSWVVI